MHEKKVAYIVRGGFRLIFRNTEIYITLSSAIKLNQEEADWVKRGKKYINVYIN